MTGEWFCRFQKPLSIRLTSLAAIITSSGPGTIYRLLTTRPSLSHWWCSDRNKWFSKYSPRRNHQSSMFRRNKTSGMKNTSILCDDRNGPLSARHLNFRWSAYHQQSTWSLSWKAERKKKVKWSAWSKDKSDHRVLGDRNFVDALRRVSSCLRDTLDCSESCPPCPRVY